MIISIDEANDLYDVSLQDGRIIKNVPINYIRSDSILCSGKYVKRVDGRHLITGRKFKIPTFQRRYAWKEDDWNQLFLDVRPNVHHMLGHINVYVDSKDERVIVVDG